MFLIAAVSAASPGFGGVITFTDSTFNNSDWTATNLFSGGSYEATQQLTGGNPGAFRYFAITSEVIPFVENIYAPGTFDPAVSGTLTSLDYSYDIGPTKQGSMFELPMLFQAGMFYTPFVLPVTTISLPAWQTFSASSMSSSDWLSEDGLGHHPDFTSSGAPIQFGVRFSSASISGGCAPLCSEGGIDNFSVTVNFTATAVPEPSTFMLITACLPLLAFIARRRYGHNRHKPVPTILSGA